MRNALTADNRTNEPTPAQVKAAIGAHRDHRGGSAAGKMRAALVAAQGAAPRAEGVPKSTYISPNLPGMIRNLWKSDPSENSVRTALKLAGDLIQELIDLKASSVLPSSDVDDGKLAEAWERGHAAFEQAWESDHLFPYDYATDNPYRKKKKKNE